MSRINIRIYIYIFTMYNMSTNALCISCCSSFLNPVISNVHYFKLQLNYSKSIHIMLYYMYNFYLSKTIHRAALGLFTGCTSIVKSGWAMTFFSIFDTSGIFFDSSDALVWLMEGGLLLLIPALPWHILGFSCKISLPVKSLILCFSG